MVHYFGLFLQIDQEKRKIPTVFPKLVIEIDGVADRKGPAFVKGMRGKVDRVDAGGGFGAGWGGGWKNSSEKLDERDDLVSEESVCEERAEMGETRRLPYGSSDHNSQRSKGDLGRGCLFDGFP